MGDCNLERNLEGGSKWEKQKSDRGNRDEKDSCARGSGRGQTKCDVCLSRETGAERKGDSVPP